MFCYTSKMKYMKYFPYVSLYLNANESLGDLFIIDPGKISKIKIMKTKIRKSNPKKTKITNAKIPEGSNPISQNP